jgi:ATP-dependent RNA circularization protein (DNA/RNA ligase family)
MEDYEVHYITENEQVFNVFNVFVFDFEKSEKQKQEQERAKILQKMKEETSNIFSGYNNKKQWYTNGVKL